MLTLQSLVCYIIMCVRVGVRVLGVRAVVLAPPCSFWRFVVMSYVSNVNAAPPSASPVHCLGGHLESYLSELDRDTSISATNVSHVSMSVGSLKTKWLRYFFLEKERLASLSDSLNKLQCKPLGGFDPSRFASLAGTPAGSRLMDSLNNLQSVSASLKAHSAPANNAVSTPTTTDAPSSSDLPNNDIASIQLEIKDCTACIDLIERSFNIFDSMNYQIKNILDSMKLFGSC